MRFTLEKQLARRKQAKRTKREMGLIWRPVAHPAPLSCPARSRRTSTAKGTQATIARALKTSVQLERREDKSGV
jgi:hypothetical protein